MTLREEIRSIVKNIVGEYFFTKEPRQKNILILLQSNTRQKESIWELVQEVSTKQKQIDLCVTEEWREIPQELSHLHVLELNQSLDSSANTPLKDMIEAADVLLIPNVTYSFLAKLSMTMDDTTALWLTIQMQLLGKPILIGTDEIALTTEQWMFAPAAVEKRITSYKRQLTKEGITFSACNNIQAQLQSLMNRERKRPILLAKHIEQAFAQEKQEICVPEKTVVTPLAQDTANELKVQILHQQRKGAFNDRS